MPDCPVSPTAIRAGGGGGWELGSTNGHHTAAGNGKEGRRGGERRRERAAELLNISSPRLFLWQISCPPRFPRTINACVPLGRRRRRSGGRVEAGAGIQNK